SQVKTRWVTELEIDNAYFTIERSSDALNFEEVVRVEGAGNSTQTLSYESFDNSPLPGVTYYRLKQTDFDGQFSYSSIKMVTIGEKSGFTFFPNPTDNELNLNVTNPSNEVKVVIYDMAGRQMFAQIYAVDSERSKSVISINAKYLLPTGIYMVNASSNGVEHRERVVLK
ncbi:MAG: T9SS type A sorting domain-containing protein, partial [Bacteroidota bacterium]